MDSTHSRNWKKRKVGQPMKNPAIGEEVVLISGMSLLADGVRMNWRTVIDGREWNSYKKDGWPREKF